MTAQQLDAVRRAPEARTLYHYTCDHGRAALGDRGTVLPGAARVEGGGPFAWFTDLAHPNRGALGLTSHLLECDRLAHRYRFIDSPEVLAHWLDMRRILPGPFVLGLEQGPAVRPRHWWVAVGAVEVVYDPLPGRTHG